MNENSVVGVYTTLREAEAATASLKNGGIPIENVLMVRQDLKGDLHDDLTVGDVAGAAAATGACIGGIYGLLVGSAFLWLPGFGPVVVAGSLAAVVGGGIEGAAISATVGWLFGVGISEEKLVQYQSAVQAGKFLIIAQGSEDVVERAHEILKNANPEKLDRHSTPATGVFR